MVVRCLLLGLIAAACALTAAPAFAAILVTVNFTYVTTEISPQQTTHSSEESSNFVMEGHRVSNPNQGAAAFGATAAGVNGDGHAYNATYRVRNGLVIETVRYPGSITEIVVSTNGADACSATVRFIKPKGHRYFEGQRSTNHEHMIMSEEHAENVRCSIARQ